MQTQGSGRHAAGLVVDTGAAVKKVCVRFDEDEITGEELLRRAQVGAVFEYESLGAAVCELCEVGNPREDCLGVSSGNSWSYYLASGGRFTYSSRGAGGRVVRDGDVDAWAWGAGRQSTEYADFSTICFETTAVAPPANPPADEPPPPPPELPPEQPPAPQPAPQQPAQEPPAQQPPPAPSGNQPPPASGQPPAPAPPAPSARPAASAQPPAGEQAPSPRPGSPTPDAQPTASQEPTPSPSPSGSRPASRPSADDQRNTPAAARSARPTSSPGARLTPPATATVGADLPVSTSSPGAGAAPLAGLGGALLGIAGLTAWRHRVRTRD